jgi:hypothetical protein
VAALRTTYRTSVRVTSTSLSPGPDGVIRMGRDTQYTVAVVDLAAAAEIMVPDAGERDLSVMVANQDDDRGDPRSEDRTTVASDPAADQIVRSRRVDDDRPTGPGGPGPRLSPAPRQSRTGDWAERRARGAG